MTAASATSRPDPTGRLLTDPVVWRLVRDLRAQGWRPVGDRRLRNRTRDWRLDSRRTLTLHLVPGYADLDAATPLGRVLLHGVTDPGYAAMVLRTALASTDDLVIGVAGPYRVEAHPQASARWQLVHAYPTADQARTEAAGIARNLPGMPIRIVGPHGPLPS